MKSLTNRLDIINRDEIISILNYYKLAAHCDLTSPLKVPHWKWDHQWKERKAITFIKDRSWLWHFITEGVSCILHYITPATREFCQSDGKNVTCYMLQQSQWSDGIKIEIKATSRYKPLRRAMLRCSECSCLGQMRWTTPSGSWICLEYNWSKNT